MAADARAAMDRGVVEAGLRRAEENIVKLARLLNEDSDRLGQTRLNLLVNHLSSRVACLFALGHETAVVYDGLVEELDARTRVLLSRRPSDGFPVINVRVVAEPTSRKPSGIISSAPQDWSVGNAEFAYETIVLALALGRVRQAREIAPLVWDPPDAPYVGHGRYALYDSCQQHVAYAAKELLLGRSTGALGQLGAGIRACRGTLLAQADAITALAEHDEAKVAESLRALLAEHSRACARAENREDPRCLLCFPLLGWSVWAIANNLLDVESVPFHEEHLPKNLVGLSLTRVEP